MSIAKTILNQLGGNKAIVMAGLKNLIDRGNGLSFHFGLNKSEANYCMITLNGGDLYDVTFGKISKADYKEIETIDAIYADSLIELFEHYTGLLLSL